MPSLQGDRRNWGVKLEEVSTQQTRKYRAGEETGDRQDGGRGSILVATMLPTQRAGPCLPS